PRAPATSTSPRSRGTGPDGRPWRTSSRRSSTARRKKPWPRSSISRRRSSRATSSTGSRSSSIRPAWRDADMKFLLDSAIRFGFDLAVKATFVFAATSVALLLMRRSTAATRHRVGTFGLGAALLLPLLSAALPQVNVPILPDVRPRPVAAADSFDAPGAMDAEPASEISWRQLALAVPEKAIPAAPEDAVAPEASPSESASPSPSDFPIPVAPRSGSSAAPSLLLFAWIAGAAAVVLRLFVGWSRVRQIGREAQPIRDVEWLVERDSAARR